MSLQDYIEQLEDEVKYCRRENEELRDQLNQMEQQVMELRCNLHNKEGAARRSTYLAVILLSVCFMVSQHSLSFSINSKHLNILFNKLITNNE